MLLFDDILWADGFQYRTRGLLLLLQVIIVIIVIETPITITIITARNRNNHRIITKSTLRLY